MQTVLPSDHGLQHFPRFLSLHDPVSAQLFKRVASAQWGLLTVFPEMLIGIRTVFKEEAG